ncbi:hypothetical protein ACOMHN_048449 [Nucella lapillus]
MMSSNLLPLEASQTMIFVEKMDKLFNTFNSRHLKCSQSMGHAFRDKSGHIEFLNDVLSWLDALKSGSSRSLPCLSGWKITIRSLLQLWEDLRGQPFDVKFLLTSRLNQDCVENLFSVIRMKGQRSDNPDPKQFRHYLQQTMVDAVLTKSKSSNCIDDGDQFILSLESMASCDKAGKKARSLLPLDDVPLPLQYQEGDDAELVNIAFVFPSLDLNMGEKNVLKYISGYMAKRLQNKVCGKCQEMLTGSLQGTQDDIFIKAKQFCFTDGQQGLTIPSAVLAAQVERWEVAFKKSAEQLLCMDNCRARLIVRLKNASSDSSALLFVTIRLHFFLKDTNRKFASQSDRQSRKMLKLSHL